MLLPYRVYLCPEGKPVIHAASTAFKEDAVAVLKNWEHGYIAFMGDIIEPKGDALKLLKL
jgi:hypothetical protein